MATESPGGGIAYNRQPDSVRPLYDGDLLRQKLHAYDRTPFLDLLAHFLECAPSPEAISKLAESNPHLYIQALKGLGLIAGFTEKREVESTLSVNVRHMSDSQLEDQLRNLLREAGLPTPKILEHEVVEAEEPSEAPPSAEQRSASAVPNWDNPPGTQSQPEAAPTSQNKTSSR